MKIKFFLASLMIAFLLSGANLNAQNGFISATDAAAKIKAKQAVIVSARSASDYQKSHWPGAINIQHKDLYKAGAIEGVLKSPEELATYFGNKGIPSDKMIIVYDDGKNKYAGRLYWTFKYLGVKDVKILHKSMADWKKARIRPSGMPVKAKKATFVAHPDPALFADYAYVKSHFKEPNVVLVDVRTPAEFAGTSTKPKSKGHISGAKNLNYESLLTATGAVKPKAELEKLTKAAGMDPSKEIILYCATSVRAGIVYNILVSDLGYNKVRVYDGALNEWVTDAANPIN
jgi:thiosulfate/3-mercaptopyruvate sulfurtransferase